MYDAAIAKYNGRILTNYGGQCVSLICNVLVDNGLPIANVNACNWWRHPNLTARFDFIPYSGNNTPQRGDIVIYSAYLPGSGYTDSTGVYRDPAKGQGAGHIEFYDRSTGLNIYMSLTANWGGLKVHFASHAGWTYVVGWMRLKSAPQAKQIPQEETMNVQDNTEMWRSALHREPENSAVLQNFVGMTPTKALATLRTVPEWLEKNHIINVAWPQVLVQLSNQQDIINKQNATITGLTQTIADTKKSSTEKQQVLSAAITTLTETTSQLETTHDTISDASKAVPVATEVTPEATKTGWFVGLLAAVLKKKK